jgi:hypothetical protein
MPSPAPNAKKAWIKPRIESGETFERLALTCVGTQQGNTSKGAPPATGVCETKGNKKNPPAPRCTPTATCSAS